MDHGDTSKEGRLLLAIQAYERGVISSIRAAARSYDVPFATLHARLRGRLSRRDSLPLTRKLT
jgi:predicted HTH domain antitoxin